MPWTPAASRPSSTVASEFDYYACTQGWAYARDGWSHWSADYDRPLGAPNVTKIGEMTLDSPFVSSTFGDTRLFFRHTFFASELEELKHAGQEDRMAEWLRYTNNTEFMKSEGAMLYERYLQQV